MYVSFFHTPTNRHKWAFSDEFLPIIGKNKSDINRNSSEINRYMFAINKSAPVPVVYPLIGNGSEG